MQNVIIFITSLTLFAATLPIQTQASERSPHQIGLAVSSYSGQGLSYQYVFNDNQRIKVTGLVGLDDNEFNEESRYNAGFELQQSLHNTSFTRLYALAGMSYSHRESKYFYFATTADGQRFLQSTSRSERNVVSSGLGFGFEVLLWEHLALNLDTGLSFGNITGTSDYKELYLGGGAGISYRF